MKSNCPNILGEKIDTPSPTFTPAQRSKRTFKPLQREGGQIFTNKLNKCIFAGLIAINAYIYLNYLFSLIQAQWLSHRQIQPSLMQMESMPLWELVFSGYSPDLLLLEPLP